MTIKKNEELRDPWKEPLFCKGVYTNRPMTEKERIQHEDIKKRQSEIDEFLKNVEVIEFNPETTTNLKGNKK